MRPPSAAAGSSNAIPTWWRSTGSISRSRRGECFGLLGPERRRQDDDDRDPRGAASTRTPARSKCSAGAGTRSRGRCAQRLGIQLQETQLNDKLTVEETLRLFRSFYQRRADRRRAARHRRARSRSATRGSASCPAARSSGCRSPARWPADPSCCSSTSRRPASIRSRGGSCGTCSSGSAPTAAPS